MIEGQIFKISCFRSLGEVLKLKLKEEYVNWTVLGTQLINKSNNFNLASSSLLTFFSF